MGEINQDPSMEDILASIKRVIADDGRPVASATRGDRFGQQEPEPDPEPLELDTPEEDVLELSNPISEDDRLTSENATVAARQSLAALAALKQQAEPEMKAELPVGDGPLEAVVREMLRPMLKDWLDQRLPEMVEEMVAREIARITGKGM